MTYRLCYSIEGPLAFLSHLEMIRLWQRALLRSGLKIAWSQGFNPRPRLSMGPARGVGVEGGGEYLDLELTEYTEAETVSAKLREVLPVGVALLGLRELPAGVKNLEAVINEAVYEFHFLDGAPAELGRAAADFMGAQQVPFVRQSPKGEKTLDLRSYVRELVVEGDFLRATVTLSNSGSLRPQELLTALGYWDIIGDINVRRSGLYIRSGNDTGRT